MADTGRTGFLPGDGIDDTDGLAARVRADRITAARLLRLEITSAITVFLIVATCLLFLARRSTVIAELREAIAELKAHAAATKEVPR